MSHKTVALLLLALLPSCLGGLGPAAEPVPIRYFSAAVPTPPAATAKKSSARLRLRAVTSASLLGKRIVWRSSDVEYGFYEAERWTELPKDWLEEALARELFESRGMQRSESLDAFTLAVHLSAFEEQLGPPHEVRVAVNVRILAPDRDDFLERSIEHSEPVTGSGTAAVAAAMSRCLAAVVEQTANLIE